MHRGAQGLAGPKSRRPTEMNLGEDRYAHMQTEGEIGCMMPWTAMWLGNVDEKTPSPRGFLVDRDGFKYRMCTIDESVFDASEKSVLCIVSDR